MRKRIGENSTGQVPSAAIRTVHDERFSTLCHILQEGWRAMNVDAIEGEMVLGRAMNRERKERTDADDPSSEGMSNVGLRR